jgi:hypothetical protein
MRGFYRIYKGDTLVCEQNNALTVVGRSLILKSLLGLIPSVGGSIAIGVHNQANPALNSDNLIDLNTMSFSIGQSPVQLATLDRTDNVDALVFKTTINDPLKYTIYEVGLYPESIQDQIIQFSDLLLFNGESDDGWTEGIEELSSKTTGSRMISGDLATAGYRIGNEAVYIDSGSTVFSTIFSKNFTNFSDKDLLKLAVDPTGDSGTLLIKFQTDDSNYYSKSFAITAGGYQILSCAKDEILRTGTPSWDNINTVSITMTGTGLVLDGIKFDDTDNVDVNYGLVSRTALATPIQKSAGEPITIEYYLVLAFNEVIA